MYIKKENFFQLEKKTKKLDIIWIQWINAIRQIIYFVLDSPFILSENQRGSK